MHLGIAGGSDYLAHVVHVLVIDDGVDRQVAFHAMFLTPLGNGVQVIEREIDTGARTHVQPLDTEVDGIGTTLMGCI